MLSKPIESMKKYPYEFNAHLDWSIQPAVFHCPARQIEYI